MFLFSINKGRGFYQIEQTFFYVVQHIFGCAR